MASDTSEIATEIRVTGRVTIPRSFSYDDLVEMPSVTETVTFVSQPAARTATFTGVLLRDLVRAAGNLTNDGHGRLDRLRKYVVARGLSGFAVVISWAEVDPNCGNAPIFVAYQSEGQRLGPEEGMARLVVPGDAHGARYVSQLVELEVRAVDD